MILEAFGVLQENNIAAPTNRFVNFSTPVSDKSVVTQFEI